MYSGHRDRLSGLQEEHKNLKHDAGRLSDMGLSDCTLIPCLSVITDRLEVIDNELQQWDRGIELKTDYLSLLLALDQLIETAINKYKAGRITSVTAAGLRNKFIKDNFKSGDEY